MCQQKSLHIGTVFTRDEMKLDHKLNNETYYTVNTVNLISQLNCCTVSTFESNKMYIELFGTVSGFQMNITWMKVLQILNVSIKQNMKLFQSTHSGVWSLN